MLLSATGPAHFGSEHLEVKRDRMSVKLERQAEVVHTTHVQPCAVYVSVDFRRLQDKQPSRVAANTQTECSKC